MKSAYSSQSFSTIAVAALLVLLFSYTSLSKFLEYDKFVFQMRLVPLPLFHYAAGMLGWVIPTLEMGITVLLLITGARRAGLLASLILLVVFEVYIIVMLFSGLQLPCTCGGIISVMSWKQHLLFNGVFIILILAALLPFPHSRKSFSRT
jgi:hypothetical protein